MVDPTWLATAPALAFGAAALLLLLADSVDPDTTNTTVLGGIAVAGSLGSLAAAVYLLYGGVGIPTGEGGTGPAVLFGGQLVVDQMALFFMTIVASVTALVTLASMDYVREHAYQAEFYSLVLLSATGMSLLAAANSLATGFVAFELVSLPSYALVAFLKKNRGSVEAGLKYFLIGAVSSSVLAYGISLVYAATGVMRFDAVATAIQSGTVQTVVDGSVQAQSSGASVQMSILGVGIVMIIGGLAFKMAAVPFHFWAPEAYEGAPAPISAFLSSASKAAGFVIAFRAFAVAFPIGALAETGGAVDWFVVFQVLAIATMFIGNFAAATQETVKRMLAYSSVGHAGYVLIGLAALTGTGDGMSLSMSAGMAHLLVYGFMNTGAFLFIALAEYWGVGRRFEDYNGLGKQAPVACAAMTVFLFSLAGLPIGGGFFSKFYLFQATLNVSAWSLAAALVINSALSLFYYSRVVKAMWIEEPTGERTIDSYPTGLYTAIVAAAVITVLLIPGFGYVSEVAFRAVELL
ncbi:NADH-quinone oxidoreductase subunit N [Haloarcula salinisoli]|uniref:NADH-quinone oxidoreductase subunit N n=1 Tax=Haloarcula salinisoli TaxID=2487746 RepID=A0A8J7YHU9_9EURY|nr:NADH-quinone oxidoreductase subunit N [Halomicroarcula salinisoli]MBX0284906.1 NADH-quinone oxidoreductase subunit N [Halomicroarcula salinisoli]MBX0303616.1 NADH-quinone oxidoreductase subunit N [Halomicroarcula salinisoli]